jgi:DNA-binding GntR family transcriptional regulator
MLADTSIPLAHKQLRHEVAEKIRAAILAGRFKPGEWLRQEHIAQELGVSQMPVREALKELVAEGLIEHLPYRGVRVVEFTPDDIIDLYSHRAFLEGIAARAAAQNITEQELQELRGLLEGMRTSLGPAHLAQYRLYNRRFHELIFKASRRQYLIRTLTQMWATFPTMLIGNFAPTASTPLPGREGNDVAEHEDILTALECRDPDAAEQAIRSHIQTTVEQFVRSLQQE